MSNTKIDEHCGTHAVPYHFVSGFHQWKPQVQPQKLLQSSPVVPRGEAEPQPDSVRTVTTGWWLVPASHPAQPSRGIQLQELLSLLGSDQVSGWY